MTVAEGTDLEVANRRGRSLEETGADLLLRRRVLAAAFQPRLEVVGLANHLHLHDVKAGRFGKCDPFPLRVDVPVGRIA